MTHMIEQLADDLAATVTGPAFVDCRNLDTLEREELAESLQRVAPHIRLWRTESFTNAPAASS